MTEATLNANNYINICLIPLKFHMVMYNRMTNISAQNQSSIHCTCVWKAVHNNFLKNTRTLYLNNEDFNMSFRVAFAIKTLLLC